jgi:uncharacterized membrane protein YbhN (UPF0104 family)
LDRESRILPFVNIRIHPLLWVLAAIGASSALGWRALGGINWPEVTDAFLSANWQALLPATAVITFAALMQTLRWKVLLPGEKISVARLYLVRSAGASVNQLLPLRVAGEAAQFAMLTQGNNIQGAKVVASIFMNRAFDLLVSTTMMSIGFFWVPQLSVFKPAIIPSVVLAVGIILLFFFSGSISRLGFLRGLRPVQHSLNSLALWRNQRPRLVLAAGVTVVAWLSLGTGAWVIAQDLGITLPFWMIAILLVILTSFSNLIPSGPGAIGVFEFASTYLLGLFTVDKTSALTFALLIHMLLFVPTLAVGMPVLLGDQKTWRRVMQSVRCFLARA